QLQGDWYAFNPSPGFYRSIVPVGNWSNVSTWEFSPDNGSSWIAPSFYPGQLTQGDLVSISGGNSVTADVSPMAALGSVTVGGTGLLELSNSNLTINGQTFVYGNLYRSSLGNGTQAIFKDKFSSFNNSGVKDLDNFAVYEFQNGLEINGGEWWFNNANAKVKFSTNNQTISGISVGAGNKFWTKIEIVGPISVENQNNISEFYGSITGDNVASTYILGAGLTMQYDQPQEIMATGNFVASLPGSMVEYRGAGSQQIKSTHYADLRFSNNSIKIIEGVVVADNLESDGGTSTSMVFSSLSPSIVSVTGNLNIQPGDGIDMSGGSLPHELYLDGASNAVTNFTAGLGKVYYNGNVNQTIFSKNYYDLEVSGSSIKTSPTSGFAVNHFLSMNGAIIDLPNDVFSINPSASIIETVPFGTGNMIRCANTTAIGFCLARVGSSAADFNSFTFPIGNSVGYSPVTINSLAASSIGAGSLMLVNPYSFISGSSNYVNRGFLVTTVGITGVTDFQPIFNYSASDTETGSPFEVVLQYPTTVSSALASSFVDIGTKTFGIIGLGNTTVNGYWIAQSLASQTILGFSPFAPQFLGNPTIDLSNVTATSGLTPITFVSSNPAVASVSGNTVTILTEGVTTITAFQNGDAIYGAATPVSQVLVVVPDKPIGNRGLYFDGVDDYVSTTIPNSLNATLEAWIKIKDLTRFSTFVSNTPNVGASGLALEYRGDGKLYMRIGADGGSGNGGFGTILLPSANSIEANKWYHVSGTYNGSVANIYINGVLENTTASPHVLNSPSTYWIGSLQPGASYNCFGQIDEVRIFNSARTPAEIQLDMATTTPNGALGYWNFEETTGNIVSDISGNGYNGVLNNGILRAIRVKDNTDNGGAGLGSLRQAINDANTDTDIDYIDFSIQQTDATLTGVRTISQSSSLTPINNPVYIDGYSAYGSSVNTNPFSGGTNAQIRVQVLGIYTPGHKTMQLFASNSTIRGLSICSGSVSLEVLGNNNHIAGNFVGLHPDGVTTVPVENYSIFIGGTGNTIGTKPNPTTFEDLNVSSIGRFKNFVVGSTGTAIRNNYINTNASGIQLTWPGHGVLLEGTSNNLIIENNVFGSGGVSFFNTPSSSVTIIGNLIGIGADGITPLPFAGSSILMGNASTNTLIKSNTIANADVGVDIGNTFIGTIISQNKIFGNTTAGIRLNATGNNNKVAPIITNANVLQISGTCAAGDIIEVFNDTPAFGATNQGRTILGVATTTGTTWSFDGSFTVGDRITATATDNINGTSPFSVASLVAPPGEVLAFDGVDDFISLPITIPLPSGNSDYTIQAYIKPSSLGDYGIVGWGDYSPSNSTNAIRTYNDGGLGILHYWYGNDILVFSSEIAAFSINLLDGAWHNVAATFDGSKRTIYVDGIAIKWDYPTGLNVTNTSNATIGVTNSTEYFKGQMDAVRIWNRALCQTEINGSLNAENPSFTEGLVAQYNFNQGNAAGLNTSISTVSDASGNGNTGTLFNFALTGATSNFIQAGAGGLVNGSTVTSTLCTPEKPLSNRGIYLEGNSIAGSNLVTTNVPT
ncbi:MAG: LamG-like jellyroll fold domain-containing protein, partial [Cytophagales bacterium]